MDNKQPKYPFPNNNVTFVLTDRRQLVKLIAHLLNLGSLNSCLQNVADGHTNEDADDDAHLLNSTL